MAAMLLLCLALRSNILCSKSLTVGILKVSFLGLYSDFCLLCPQKTEQQAELPSVCGIALQKEIRISILSFKYENSFARVSFIFAVQNNFIFFLKISHLMYNKISFLGNKRKSTSIWKCYQSSSKLGKLNVLRFYADPIYVASIFLKDSRQMKKSIILLFAHCGESSGLLSMNVLTRIQ